MENKAGENTKTKMSGSILLVLSFLLCIAITCVVRYAGLLNDRHQKEVGYTGKELKGTYFTVDIEKKTVFSLAEIPNKAKQAGKVPERRAVKILQTATIGEKNWAQIEFAGIKGWLSAEKIYKISDDDRAAQKGSKVFAAPYSVQKVNLYAEPAWNKEAVFSDIPYGTEFTVLDVNGGWGKVEYQGKEVWVNLAFMATYAGDQWIVQTMDVSQKKIPLQSENSKDGKTITYIPNGAELFITEFQNGWGKTKYQGKEGWVKIMDLMVKVSLAE